jgi:gamma-glutamyl-gamma-aminobutyrate hydrolase PuuD
MSRTYFTPKEYSDYAVKAMMKSKGFSLVDNPDEADVVVWTGGADVSPILYHEQTIHPLTYSDAKRDEEEMELYLSLPYRKPKIGICRGGQFLNVMNGGLLWQHVDRHSVYGFHAAYSHFCNRMVMVTSTHHQMMIPGKHGHVLMDAAISTFKEDGEESRYLINHKEDRLDKFASGADIEAVWYPQTNSVCFQPHPEHANTDMREEFFLYLEMLLEADAQWDLTQLPNNTDKNYAQKFVA